MANCEWTSFLPNTDSGRALAASVRSGATPGLSVEFHALDEASCVGCQRDTPKPHRRCCCCCRPAPTTSRDALRFVVEGSARGLVATMSWWRRQPEVRGAGGYTETRLLEQFTRAISGNVRHGALGGLQCAAGAVARAFAAAGVENDDGLLDATTLYSMGFDLVREGQSIWLLDVGTGRPRLSRASTGSDVYRGLGRPVQVVDLPAHVAGALRHDDRPRVG